MDRDRPHPRLAALSDLMVGRWRVSGPGIAGDAEYALAEEGRVLVLSVVFTVDGSRVTNIQHIAYDGDADALRSRYLDTAGASSTYTWALEGDRLTVADEAGTFEARVDADGRRYTGTWRDASGVVTDPDEVIVYARTD